MNLLSRLLRNKLCAIIDKHQALILDMYNHIWLTIAIHVFEFRCNWCQILPIAEQCRAIIDTGMRSSSPRQFDNHDMPVEVEKHKV